jgi:hypothetical protein
METCNKPWEDSANIGLLRSRPRCLDWCDLTGPVRHLLKTTTPEYHSLQVTQGCIDGLHLAQGQADLAWAQGLYRHMCCTPGTPAGAAQPAYGMMLPTSHTNCYCISLLYARDTC